MEVQALVEALVLGVGVVGSLSFEFGVAAVAERIECAAPPAHLGLGRASPALAAEPTLAAALLFQQ